MKKKKKSSMPTFIPNQPGGGILGLDQGKRNKEEKFKQRENQKKLALRRK